MRRIGYGLRQFIDFILPPQNLLAYDEASQSGPHWQDIKFLDEPCCYACGFPFDYEAQTESLCAHCLASPPQYDRARAAFVYDDISRAFVLNFKHGGRTDKVEIFAAQMQRAGRRLLNDANVIMPVPLHRSRLRQRRYNQAAILARRISQGTNIAFDPDSLLRKSPTPSQGGKSAAARRQNVKGAFTVAEKRREKIRHQNIILVDDVMTTGATLNACAKVLKRAGAARVDAICLARVVHPLNLPK